MTAPHRRAPACRRALAGAVFILASACSQPLTVEQQVIAVIRDMEARAEAGERRPFMAHVAPDFSGRHDSMNRDQLSAFLLYQLRRHERVQVQLFPIVVHEEGAGRASARFRVLVLGGAGLVPERGQLFEVDTTWGLREGEWLLLAADWNPVELVPGSVTDPEF